MSKILKITFFLTFTGFALCVNKIYAQSLVSDISSPDGFGASTEIFTETVRIISRSQKIFILTNTNEMLNKGDFITLVLGEKDPVARALVGKTHDSLAGIKIIKIYSLKRWSSLKKGLEVGILKGDDSRLFVKEEKKEVEEEGKIESEEDLYQIDEGIIEEDVDFFSKDNRYIRTDNVVGAAWSQYSFENTLLPETETKIGTQWAFSWAYQFNDNYWAEGLYGRTLLSNFPAQSTQTLVNNFTIRLKYTFKAPLYSYIMPYVGYQIYNVSSPNAGQSNDPTLNAKEENLINELGQDQPVFGLTLLRRLVPGWFFKADLGNDIIALGAAIEF
ncbi:MAG: hypothetical protein CME64_07175 [Halobacteriovoraceae bacterium]|nr:hypothetical protein [Halobacteriovoraceae bacterium]